jgi:hypothetical protein
MLNISAVQATPEPVERLREIFGGTVAKRLLPYRGAVRVLFTWQTSSRLAEQVLVEMRPFLIAKADEADLALEFRQTFRPQFGDRSKNPPELEDRRHAMMVDLQQMRKDKREQHLPVAA